MTNWRPVSELTPEIVISTRYMLLLVDSLFGAFDGALFALDGEICLNGAWALSCDSGRWVLEDTYGGDDVLLVVWFMSVDVPKRG